MILPVYSPLFTVPAPVFVVKPEFDNVESDADAGSTEINDALDLLRSISTEHV